MSESVKVKGGERLAATLGTMGDQLTDWSGPNADVAELLAGAAARSAPRRSGALAGSHIPVSDATAAGVAASARYAAPLAFGVGPRAGLRGPHNIAANPWIWQASSSAEPAAIKVYEAHRDAAVAQVKGA